MTLPTKAQWLDILKRSAVTFVAVFLPTFGAAAADAHYQLALLGGLALSSAAAAVNVVIRTIWKPKLVEIETVLIPALPTAGGGNPTPGNPV